MKIYTEEEIKKKKDREFKIIKGLKFIFMPIILLAILLAGYIGYQKLYLKKDNVDFLGYKFYIVMTESMKDTIDAGDLIIVKQVPEKEIRENDIVTFKLDNADTTITHRIIERKLQSNGKIGYITKGDNNNAEDMETINYEQIQGKVIKKITKVGFIISKSLTGVGLMVIIGLIILSYVHSSKKEDRKLAREYARKKFNVCKYKKDE